MNPVKGHLFTGLENPVRCKQTFYCRQEVEEAEIRTISWAILIKVGADK